MREEMLVPLKDMKRDIMMTVSALMSSSLSLHCFGCFHFSPTECEAKNGTSCEECLKKVSVSPGRKAFCFCWADFILGLLYDIVLCVKWQKSVPGGGVHSHWLLLHL